jgi:hypothetical protein
MRKSRRSSQKITFRLAKSPPTSFLTVQHHDDHDNFASFTVTNSASNSLRALSRCSSVHRQRKTRPQLALDINITFGVRSSDSSPSSLGSLLPNSPAPSIPSISRRPLACDQNSAASSTTTSPKSSHARSATSLNGILAQLESQSRLCNRNVICVTCRKPGVDFPKCSKCGDMWCSRECRLYGGAKRHICYNVVSS